MILVTLGTQDKKYYRILEDIQKLIDKKIIKDEVIVQAGVSCDFKSNDMKIFDLIPIDEFNKLIKECNILITHGGVGTILEGLKNNKKIIVAPRLAKYKEHHNDHQVQIVSEFAEKGYIIPYYDGDDLDKIIKSIKKFEPKKYKSNNKKFVKIVDSLILEKNSNNLL